MLTSPQVDRVDIALEGLGPAGPYVPAVAESLSIPAMTTITVDLTAPLAGEATAVRVTAPEAVGAALVTGGAGSPATVVAGQLGADLAGLVPGSGTLHLSNPSRSDAEAAEVTLTPTGGTAATQQVTVEPGHTAAVAVPAGDPVVVSVTADGELIAGASTVGPAGTVVVPLGPAADAPTQTLPAELQPGLR